MSASWYWAPFSAVDMGKDRAIACSKTPASAHWHHPTPRDATVAVQPEQAQLASYAASLVPTGVHGHGMRRPSTSVVVDREFVDEIASSSLFGRLTGGGGGAGVQAPPLPRERIDYKIRPLTTILPHVPKQIGPEQSSLEVDCAPYIPAIHPDGTLYFFDEDRRLFTDTNMHDPDLRYGKVLLLSTEDSTLRRIKYYACHEARCLFWLDVYDANCMVLEVFCVTSPAHVKHRLEGLYWAHYYLFPAVFDGHCLQPAVYDELLGILSHGCMGKHVYLAVPSRQNSLIGTTGILTSKSSTLLYDDDTIQKMVNLVRKVKEQNLMLVVYHTAGVRTRQSILRKKQERSLLTTLLSLLLFLAPEVHLQEIENAWTDEIIIERVWKEFTTKLVGEWEELILWVCHGAAFKLEFSSFTRLIFPSTVMLSANVGFLAIPGVVIFNIINSITSASQVDIFVSPAQIASSMSTLASVANIVIGMLLVYHNGPKQNADPAGAVSAQLISWRQSVYFYKRVHRTLGFEPVAIVFSLPWALLMWAQAISPRRACFFITLLFFNFHHSNNSTWIFVTVASAILAALIGWFIRWVWESSDGRGVWIVNLLPSLMRALSHARVRYYNLFGVISRRGHPSSPNQANILHSTPNREEREVV
ncbi:hypothetical protein H4582DRAFT_2053868 [Lactarius indigo]|nr:hypothetical protein H4582DRAFT_2053868 [Lactarius indigo]